MNSKDYNARLYEKMEAEQDRYRDWLLYQEPAEILNHTYEYTVREDIVMCMEELKLEPEKAKALLRSPCPLSDVYKEFRDRETEHMDTIRDSIETEADMPIGMLVVLDSILNRITANRAKGKNTFIFIDEIYLLFQHEYSANFLFTLWKRVRKYGAYATGITQNVDDLLQSHTARTMLANSEFIIMLNQAPTDRIELAKLLNISDNQLSYITNVGAGHGLIKVGSSLIPFANKFPKNTKLYKLMTTKPGEGV